MAASSRSSWFALALLLFVAHASTANSAKLLPSYYDKTCPNVQSVVRAVMAHKVTVDPSLAPAVLRLFFHDCFVNGCDGSVLLDGRDSERHAEANDSLRGFEVIDEIKSLLEDDCPATVSCADVLALASRDAVSLLGGPSWNVPLGRMDSRADAGKDAVDNGALPSPRDKLTKLVAVFRERGLDARDMTALSGAHTVGMARCQSYRGRVYGTDGDDNIDPSFAETMRQKCPLQGPAGDDVTKAPFDVHTPMRFDNAYYKDLVARRGLLTSDQTLYGERPQDDLVEMYSTDGEEFARDFAKAMVKMGNIPPPKGMPVEVRLSCKMANHYW